MCVCFIWVVTLFGDFGVLMLFIVVISGYSHCRLANFKAIGYVVQLVEWAGGLLSRNPVGLGHVCAMHGGGYLSLQTS